MDTDGDGTVTKEVRYLIQILNSRCPIHILFRLKLIYQKTINLDFKLSKSIYLIAEKIILKKSIFSPMKHFNVCEKGKEAGSEGV